MGKGVRIILASTSISAVTQNLESMGDRAGDTERKRSAECDVKMVGGGGQNRGIAGLASNPLSGSQIDALYGVTYRQKDGKTRLRRWERETETEKKETREEKKGEVNFVAEDFRQVDLQLTEVLLPIAGGCGWPCRGWIVGWICHALSAVIQMSNPVRSSLTRFDGVP
jgi:hypothetical protein